MAWSNPGTAVALTQLTAAFWNTNVRDNLNAAIPVTSTITTTGTQTALAIPAGRGALVIFANNATLLNIQGVTAAQNGQILTIHAIGAGRVDIEHQNGSASAANRVINQVSQTISLAPGFGCVDLVYDSTTARWRVKQHSQGAALSYTPSWTATAGSPAIGNGTISGSYYIDGKQVTCRVNFTVGSTTTLAGTAWGFSVPYASGAAESSAAAVKALDSGTAHRIGTASLPAGTSSVSIFSDNDAGSGWGTTTPFTWATGDTFYFSITYFID